MVNSEGNLYVGYAGTGALNILDDGHVNSGAYDTIASVGHLPGSMGEVVVDGANSQWVTAHLTIGEAGHGVLTASAGGHAYAGQSFTVADAGEGHVTVSDALLTTNNTIIGRTAGSNGTVTLENLGLWDHYSGTPADPFVVGDAGVGTLNILSDSDVILHFQALPILGNQAQGRGVVNVDGAGSELVVEAQDMSVGRYGRGDLNITDGGLVLLQGAAADVLVGENLDSEGFVQIAGADSTLAASTAFVGFLGSGIARRHRRRPARGWVTKSCWPKENSATGIAVVDGGASRLSVLSEDGLLIVGGDGDGTLTVSGGAMVSAADIVIADGSVSIGKVLVTGPGSRLSGEEILIGNNGDATLTLADGGVASAALVEINALSSLKGNGTLEGDVTSFGLVSPGASPGALSIDGDYTQAAEGEVLIELASASSFDRLLVTGDVTLDGALSVNLLDGFAPQAGQSFDVLDWDGVLTGAFAALDLPALPGSLEWDASELYALGVLSVVSPFTADFDLDGDVDADDLTQWRGDFGLNGLSDADNDGDSDGADFLAWQQQLGSGVPATTFASSVPEPAGAILLLGVPPLLLALARRRSR